MLISSTWIQTSNSNGMLGSPLVSSSSSFQKPVSYLLTKSSRRIVQIKARVVDGSQNHPPSKRRNPLVAVLEVPQVIWRQTLQPLSNFGFGQKSIWEGGVGLFVVSGVALVALSLAWLRGFHLRSQLRKYQAVFEFSQACGLCVGTPVRIRGVTVGKVVHVNSSLKSIDAVVEGGGPTPAPTGTTEWCVATGGASEAALQANIDYACSTAGVDCGPIQAGGPCFQPNTAQAHANYAMNAYYQFAGRHDFNCDFGRTGVIVTNDPSYGYCKYST